MLFRVGGGIGCLVLTPDFLCVAGSISEVLDIGVSAFFHACTVGGVIAVVFPHFFYRVVFGSARVEFVNEVDVFEVVFC